MACDCLRMKDPEEFSNFIKSRDIGLIIKMVKCVLNANKKNLKKVDMFDITFKNKSSMLFTINDTQYKELLSNCLKDLEKVEEYELCAEIIKVLNSKPKKTRNKKLTNEKQNESIQQHLS
jgi:hypothetical protein